MRLFACKLLFATIASAWLVGGSSAAEGSALRDEAGLFSTQTRANAEQKIEELRRLYKTTLIVDSVASMPGATRKQWRWFDVPISGQAYTRWAEERSHAAGEPDIYVLIC